MLYVRSFIIKNAYWGHTAKNSGQKCDFAILELSACTSIGIVSFGFDPGFEQLLTAAQSRFQIDRKDTFGKFMNSTPPSGT